MKTIFEFHKTKYSSLSDDEFAAVSLEGKSEEERQEIMYEFHRRKKLESERLSDEERRRRSFEKFILHPEDIEWDKKTSRFTK